MTGSKELINVGIIIITAMNYNYSYAQYWRLRLSQTTLTDVSVVIKTNSKPTGRFDYFNHMMHTAL